MPWLSRGAALGVLLFLGAAACNGQDNTRLVAPPELDGVTLRQTPLGVTSYIDRPDAPVRAPSPAPPASSPSSAGGPTAEGAALGPASPASPSKARAPRLVVLVSVDGLAPYVLATVQAPTLERLAREGISYQNAQTVVPSITLTSHVSMLSGVPPEEHKVLWNYYDPDQKVRTPTIFTHCRAHGLRCGIIAGKEKFLHFAEIEPGVQHYEYQPSAGHVVAQAIRYIVDQRPDFVFVHVGEVDATGHAYGWNSAQQHAAIVQIDAELGLLVAALKSYPRPVALIVTADHGGHGRTHGEDIPLDRSIPWIGSGDGLQKLGVTSYPRAVSTMDTAATVLGLLQVPVPLGLSGHAVALEASSPDTERTSR
jgi:arylsulfatase A-like enzyme